jgi:hypothetical protein
MVNKPEILVEEVLAESKKENGKYFLECIAIAANHLNRNRRVYPYDILKPEVDRYIREEVENNSAYGECGHPEGRLSIDLSNVSHRIISLAEDGNFWKAKSSILDTPKGNIIKAIMEDNGRIGMSTRAAGSVKKSNDSKSFIVESVSLKTIDVVLQPSVKESVLEAIYEHKEVMYCEDEQCYMLVEDINCKLKNAKQKDIEKVMLEQFQRYVNHLKLR